MDSHKIWKLVATDEKGKTSEKTTSITFLNNVYYGVAPRTEFYNSNFVTENLTKELRSNAKSSFTVTANEGQYIYYCQPTRMGECSFKVGGFDGGFTSFGTIEVRNGSGYKEDYYVYRSDNTNLGQTTVTVQ